MITHRLGEQSQTLLLHYLKSEVDTVHICWLPLQHLKESFEGMQELRAGREQEAGVESWERTGGRS